MALLAPWGSHTSFKLSTTRRFAANQTTTMRRPADDSAARVFSAGVLVGVQQQQEVVVDDDPYVGRRLTDGLRLQDSGAEAQPDDTRHSMWRGAGASAVAPLSSLRRRAEPLSSSPLRALEYTRTAVVPPPVLAGARAAPSSSSCSGGVCGVAAAAPGTRAMELLAC